MFQCNLLIIEMTVVDQKSLRIQPIMLIALQAPYCVQNSASILWKGLLPSVPPKRSSKQADGEVTKLQYSFIQTYQRNTTSVSIGSLVTYSSSLDQQNPAVLVG